MSDPVRRWPSERGRRPRRRRTGAPTTRSVVTDADGLAPKMFELARPLVPQGGDATPVDWQNALAMVASAWNATVMPASLEAAIGQVDADDETRDLLRTMMEAVMAHKQIRYPDDERIIVDWELTHTTGGEARLEVSAGRMKR